MPAQQKFIEKWLRPKELFIWFNMREATSAIVVTSLPKLKGVAKW